MISDERHSGAEGEGTNVTVVYIDSLFLLNFVINYLLLLASARLAGEVIHRLWLALGAALGAGYAAAVFFPGMGFLLHPLCKLGVAVLMTLIGFRKSRRLLRVTLIFLGLACALGGGIFAIGLLGGRTLTLKNGVLYSKMDLKMLLLSASVCYLILSLVFRRSAGHSVREQKPAILSRNGKKVVLTALLDTGNTLTDPVTGKPVMVADWQQLTPLLPSGVMLDEPALRTPVETLECLAEQGTACGFRLLPYQAVGVECGMLLALSMERVQVGVQDYGSILVAMSPNRISDGGGYNALIGIPNG